MGSTSDSIVNESSLIKDRRGRLLLIVLGIVAATLILVTGIAASATYFALTGAAERGTAVAETVQDECDNGNVDSSKLCADATEAVDQAPESVKGQKGDKGDTGDAGAPGPPPSAAQVANAVALYCAGGRCNGNDGRNATQGQVAEAVAAYCNDQGQCRGGDGAAGRDGQDGATGKAGDTGATGQQGPPPSDSQVASAVAAYCSDRNNCLGDIGPVGPQGDTGAAGTPGDTIEGGSCEYVGLGSITITLNTSNGPTQFSCTGTP